MSVRGMPGKCANPTEQPSVGSYIFASSGDSKQRQPSCESILADLFPPAVQPSVQPFAAPQAGQAAQPMAQTPPAHAAQFSTPDPFETAFGVVAAPPPAAQSGKADPFEQLFGELLSPIPAPAAPAPVPDYPRWSQFGTNWI